MLCSTLLKQELGKGPHICEIILPNIGGLDLAAAESVVAAFVDWLYALDLRWFPLEDLDLPTHLYLLAFRYQIPRLLDNIMLWCFRNFQNLRRLPLPSEITAAFKHMPSRSPLCLLYVDLYRLRWTSEADLPREYLRSKLPAAFMYEWSFRSIGIEQGSLSRVNMCDYHEHEDEDESSSCRYLKMWIDRGDTA
jgi:hypothetical protein